LKKDSLQFIGDVYYILTIKKTIYWVWDNCWRMIKRLRWKIIL
jgi:hypothetical protein